METKELTAEALGDHENGEPDKVKSLERCEKCNQVIGKDLTKKKKKKSRKVID